MGRYLHAIIALGKDRTCDESFYANLTDKGVSLPPPPINNEDLNSSTEEGSVHDEGGEYLDIFTDLIDGEEEQKQLEQDVLNLGSDFCKDVTERIAEKDIQYLTGLKKFFTVYLRTVTEAEPAISATPKLSSLLHTSQNRVAQLMWLVYVTCIFNPQPFHGEDQE